MQGSWGPGKTQIGCGRDWSFWCGGGAGIPPVRAKCCSRPVVPALYTPDSLMYFLFSWAKILNDFILHEGLQLYV